MSHFSLIINTNAGEGESILSMEGEDNPSLAMQKLITSCSLFYGSFPRFGVLLLMCILFSVVQIADGGCVQPREIEACPMIDYKVYGDLDVDAAEEKLEAVVSDRLDQWKSVSVKSKGKKKNKQQKLDFCEDLIRATICNLLIPPCEGTGLERYRKPCKAFEQAIKHGCGLDIGLGDLSFAEPPDCYELPIRKGEAEYADAEAIGSDSVDSDHQGRADDLTQIAKVLDSVGQTEYAVHLLLNVLRYRPDDAHAHLEIFSSVHAAFEKSKSLQLQLNMTQDSVSWDVCQKNHKVDKKYKQHKGLLESKKIEYIRELGRKFGSRYMIETGTWYGETINAVKGQFEKIVSIEISTQLAEHARKRFKGDLNIQIINGDSLVVLPKIIEERDRSVPTLFWLDGHFSGSRFETAKAELDTPIMIELDAVMRNVKDHDIVLIDDARLFRGYGDCGGDFRSECYPSIEELRRVVCHHRPGWAFEVHDDLMRIHRSVSEEPREKKTTSKQKVKIGGQGAAPSWGAPKSQTQSRAPRFTSSGSNVRSQPVGTVEADDSGAFHVKL